MRGDRSARRADLPEACDAEDALEEQERAAAVRVLGRRALVPVSGHADRRMVTSLGASRPGLTPAAAPCAHATARRHNCDARVWSDHRRTPSIAARTSSTVRGCIGASVAITGWPPCLSMRAGVSATKRSPESDMTRDYQWASSSKLRPSAQKWLNEPSWPADRRRGRCAPARCSGPAPRAPIRAGGLAPSAGAGGVGAPAARGDARGEARRRAGASPGDGRRGCRRPG